MKNTSTNEFKAALKAYLEPIIQDKAEGYETTIEGNPYQWIIDTAKGEVPHEFRAGDQAGLTYWLSGLGMNIDYTYCGMIKVAESLHDCKLTEKQADKVCAKWFEFIAVKILQFAQA